MLSRIFVSNIDACRLEAEISNEAGDILAILYEDQSGTHLEYFGAHTGAELPAEFIKQVQTEISAYSNRTGVSAPKGLTRAGLALWLMQKNDGTAMGVRL